MCRFGRGDQSLDIAIKVLEIVGPVFLVAGVGFAWVRLGFEYRVAFVTRLAMTLAMPCLIFVSLMQTEIAPSALGAVSLAAFVAYMVVGVLTGVFVLMTRLDRRTYLAPLIFSNTGNLGLPLAFFAFGQEGLGYAVVIFAVSAVIQFTIGIWLVAGETSFRKLVQEPLVGATVLGGLFLWQGWETPALLTDMLSLIGQMAIPLMLLTLGVAVARLEFSGILRPLALSVVKLGICLCAGIGAGLWFDLSPVAFGALVMQLVTPVAVTSYMLAEKYGADSDSVAGLVVISTFMAVIALPFLLATLL